MLVGPRRSLASLAPDLLQPFGFLEVQGDPLASGGEMLLQRVVLRRLEELFDLYRERISSKSASDLPGFNARVR